MLAGALRGPSNNVSVSPFALQVRAAALAAMHPFRPRQPSLPADTGAGRSVGWLLVPRMALHVTATEDWLLSCTISLSNGPASCQANQVDAEEEEEEEDESSEGELDYTGANGYTSPLIRQFFQVPSHKSPCHQPLLGYMTGNALTACGIACCGR